MLTLITQFGGGKTHALALLYHRGLPSALVEQVAAAAQSLSGQTEGLMGQVRRFRVAA